MGECDRGRRAFWGTLALVACASACVGDDTRAGIAPPACVSGDRDPACLRPIASCPYGSFDCNPAVDDVIGQITALPEEGEQLAFHRGILGDLPTRAHHWQSVQRLAGPKGNYLVLTRSTWTADDSDIAVVELASRDPMGGRLGCNGTRPLPQAVMPPADDRVIAEARVRTRHTHAGGTQLVGEILAVPLEETAPGSGVELFDLANPAAPVSLGVVDHVVRDGSGHSNEAGTASLARLDDGKFVLVIGRRHARVLDFYVSTTSDIRATEWSHLDTWRAGELKTTIDDTNFGAYQNLQLVAGTDRRLYLVGTHEHGTFFTSQWVDVYTVDGATDMTITKVGKRRITCDGCSLDAGGGIYVDPAGELIVYGVEYAALGGSTIQMMEL